MTLEQERDPLLRNQAIDYHTVDPTDRGDEENRLRKQHDHEDILKTRLGKITLPMVTTWYIVFL